MGLFSGIKDALFGGGKQKLEFDNRPWSEAQRKALNHMYKEAQRLYDLTKGDQYPGEFYAGLHPFQTAAGQRLYEYGAGPGAALASGVSDVAQQYMGAAPSLLSRLMSSSAPGVLSDAALYADNPYMQGMIQAATRDDVRAVTEGILPSIETAAAGTGNVNSSRTAMQAAIAQRGLEDRIADVSAALRGGAYQQGLGMGLADQQFRTAQLAGAVGTGLGAAGQGLGMGIDALKAQLGAGELFQADEQARLDALFQKWMLNQGLPWDRLGQYASIITPNTGSTGYQAAPSPSMFQQLAGAGLGALGTYGILKGL